ncbi:cell surface A33 antigen-like [Ascaphus truei]|uniref:cell surface A33 antigen-like n=1 Tax=Ascaphus truei TaxID=8439 RepID=UPI003F59D3E1
MRSLLLRIGFLLLLSFGAGFCNAEVDQVPLVSAMTGSNVTLSCLFKPGLVSWSRVTPYWLLRKPDGTVIEYMHPPRSRFTGRVQIGNPADQNDMSISISNLQLSDTDVYECFMSLLLGLTSSSKAGHGTLLYVHGPIQVDHIGTELTCQTQGKMVENISLIWETGDGNQHSMERQNPDGPYWSSNLTVQCDDYKAKGNLTFNCLLRHNSGYNIINQSIEVPCKGMPSELRQPVIFYTAVLGSSFLILLIVSLLCLRKRQPGRQRNRQKVLLPFSSIF